MEYLQFIFCSLLRLQPLSVSKEKRTGAANSKKYNGLTNKSLRNPGVFAIQENKNAKGQVQPAKTVSAKPALSL